MTFYVETAGLASMMESVRDRVIPRYGDLTHFLGMTVVSRAVAGRSEVIVASFWDDGLEASEPAFDRFVKEIAESTGGNPIRSEYDTLYAHVRNSTRTFGVAGMQWNGRPRRHPPATSTGDRKADAVGEAGSVA
jgi:hypothetical protein